MTKDNFEYWSDSFFEYTRVLNFYSNPPFENKKGKKFIINIKLNALLNEDLISCLTDFAKHWTWGEDRFIKAFKLLKEEFEDNRILYIFETVRKSRTHDEIKYFLFDIGGLVHFYNLEIIRIGVKGMSTT